MLKISRNFLRILHNFCYVDNHANLAYNIEYLSISGSSCFFGYHDLDPCFDNGDKILSHVYKGKSSNSEAIDSLIDVGYFQKKKGVGCFKKLAIQVLGVGNKGARLQILGNSGNVPIALYNIRTSENSFGAVAISLNDRTIHDKWEVPFNAVSRSGQYGGVLNFGLLGLKRPGYGYSVNKVDELPYIKVLCLSTKEVVYEEEFKSDVEYINHMSFSPDDKWLIYFKFFKSASQERVRSLCVVDLENRVQFDELLDLNFSHFDWLDKNTLVMSVSHKLSWIALKYNIPERSRKK